MFAGSNKVNELLCKKQFKANPSKTSTKGLFYIYKIVFAGRATTFIRYPSTPDAGGELVSTKYPHDSLAMS